jgi:Cu(I)/Ag(I) efflux system membrane fusion protein
MAKQINLPLPALFSLALVLTLALAFSAWSAWALWLSKNSDAAAPALQAEESPLYYCPMHPDYTSDKPGSCPICGMDLVPYRQAETPQAPTAAHDHSLAASEDTVVTKYTCPMHPQIIEDSPGSCPICGMDLVPIQIEERAPESHTEADHSAHAEPPGYATISIPPERRQLIGVKTDTAKEIEVKKTIRTVGFVAVDENKVAHIHSKFGGWIEHARAKVVGELVTKGQPLLTIYSPELVSAQEEFLLALRAQNKTADSSVKEILTGGSDLVRITRKRLELWDIPEQEIERLARDGEPRKNMTLYAPLTGYITATQAVDGSYIEPGTHLYAIVDLSEVWVLADVYESDLPLISKGRRARLDLSYLPGREFDGRVDYIYPILDAKTRTAKVRFVFPNPGLELKPEMYVNVLLSRDMGRRLAVPEEALLDTGETTIVFVDLGDGRLQPRRVTAGPRVDDFVVIEAGLSPGERVVTSANFLIDSESRTKAAFQALASSEPQAEHRH